MAPDMKRILMPFGLILVLEAIAAERAFVLFLGLVGSAVVGRGLDGAPQEGGGK
jgi:hypothetical protein